MKKYGKVILLSLGIMGFLASCQCKTCKRTGDPSYTFCKDDGTEQEYNDLIDIWSNNGYECN